jgi:flagellar biosynthesis protein FlhF
VKIKRFVDTDMRHVLQRVREDQGPDAVILSNRRVEGGIEVIAAVDYDEALMQQALGSAPESAEIAADVLREEDSTLEADRSNVEDVRKAGIEILAADLSPVTHTSASSEAAESPESGAITDGPALRAMHSEISSLRGLLETQLSGLVWKDAARRSPIRAQVLRNLARIGISADVANIIVNRLEPIQNIKQIWRAPLTELAQLIPAKEDLLLQQGGVAALIGPTGVGKTTTIAKMAARYAMSNGSDEIALVCADAYRIGAKEHLAAFANIMGVKVHSASNPGELAQILDRLKSKKLVLIDTEGLSQRDADLSSRLAAYGSNQDRVRFYLTLSAASQEAGLDETIRRFSKVPLAGTIVTKIDEAGQLGCVLSTLIRNGLAASWLSNGQHVPDDLHAADKKRLWLVNQAVECMEESEPRIDERFMAEKYSQVSVAHA